MTSRVIRLGKVSPAVHSILLDSNEESAKVWNLCKDKLQEAMRDRKSWPTLTSLCNDTKGKFDLHSQSVQQICRAFVACVDSCF